MICLRVRYSLLPALSIEGIIWAKIVEGSFTKPFFQEFIAELLQRMQPFPARNSVIVMDNAQIHKNREVVDMIHARSVFILFFILQMIYLHYTEECVSHIYLHIHLTTTLLNWRFQASKLLFDKKVYSIVKTMIKRRMILMYIYISLMQIFRLIMQRQSVIFIIAVIYNKFKK
jgi:hypothetical protein